MDVGRAFSFIFEDRDWIQKVGLAALVTLIPIIGQIFLAGWMLEITLRVIRKDPVPLPELDFGKNLTRGFQSLVVTLVYSLPAIALSLLFVLIAFLTGDLSSNQPGALFWISFACFMILALVYSLVIALIQPAALANMVDHNELSAGLRFGEVIALFRASPLTYVITILCVILANLVASVGTIACFVGVVFTAALAAAFTGHLYGQAYNEAKERLYHNPLVPQPGPQM
jgi:hypothetical protein